MDGPPAGLTCSPRARLALTQFKSGGGPRSDEPEGAEQPVESSCRPTSKASLSVSERDVVKQLKYWREEGEEAEVLRR